MLENLLKRKTDAEADFDRAHSKVIGATLDGADAATLRRHRAKRRDAAELADDATEAIGIAEARRADESARAAEQERKERLAAVGSAHADLRKAAKAVDDALAALETAVARYGDAQRELDARRSAAGLGRDTGFALKGRQNMRWATWNGAPTYAGLAEIPFANARRRHALAALVPSDARGDTE